MIEPSAHIFALNKERHSILRIVPGAFSMKFNTSFVSILSISGTGLIVVAVYMVFLFAVSTPVIAAGGGGGGSFNSPSQSAPSFDPVAKYQEGIAALKSGENRKAEKAFRKVVSVNKKHANSQYYLGLALFGQDKFKKSKRPFEKALKYDKKLVSAHGYLGVVFQKTNKPEKVEKHREVLMELKASCNDCKNKEKIDRALLQIDGAALQSRIDLDVTPARGDQLYVDAVAQINQGNYHAALESLAESAAVFGPHPNILTYQGFANRKLGNKAKALEFYQVALSIDSDHRGANEYLGEYYVEVGRLDLAKAQLQKLESICSFGCEEAQELRRWIVSAS